MLQVVKRSPRSLLRVQGNLRKWTEMQFDFLPGLQDICMKQVHLPMQKSMKGAVFYNSQPPYTGFLFLNAKGNTNSSVRWKDSVAENVNRCRARMCLNPSMSKEKCDRYAPANMNKRISTTLFLTNKAQKEWPK